MKKTFILAAAVAMIAMTSCKKDYTCACEYVQTDADGNVIGEGSTENTANMKKSDAEEWCDNQESTVESGGATAKTTCELK